MISKLFNAKAVAITAVIAFFVGGFFGSGVVYKWAQAQETGRLQTALELADKEKGAALDSLTTYYESRPPKIQTEVKYVIKTLKYDADCAVNGDERRLLNNARQGLLAAPGGVDGGDSKSGAPSAPGSIRRGAEVLAHVDAATRYRECFAVAKAVRQYLVDRAD